MSEEKIIKSRVVNTSGTTLQWEEVGDSLTPESGEIIVYRSDNNCTYCRIKIGDGKTSLKDLPFIIPLNSVADKDGNFIFDAGTISDAEMMEEN